MRVGVFQCDGDGLDPGQRISRLGDAVNVNSFDVVVCPELFISGYKAGDELVHVAEQLAGRWFTEIADVAISHKTAIICGYPELDAGKMYNSAFCLDSHGDLIANHRKLMIPPGFEPNYFDEGNKVTLFELGGFTVAILICYDAEYPEAVRHVAQAGAQIVVVPTALSDDWGIVAEKVIPARAFENGVWVVYANHAGSSGGSTFYGGSCIVRPDGSDSVRAGPGECLIDSLVDKDSIRRAQARLPYLTSASALLDKLEIPS